MIPNSSITACAGIIYFFCLAGSSAVTWNRCCCSTLVPWAATNLLLVESWSGRWAIYAGAAELSLSISFNWGIGGYGACGIGKCVDASTKSTSEQSPISYKSCVDGRGDDWRYQALSSTAWWYLFTNPVFKSKYLMFWSVAMYSMNTPVKLCWSSLELWSPVLLTHTRDPNNCRSFKSSFCPYHASKRVLLSTPWTHLLYKYMAWSTVANQ